MWKYYYSQKQYNSYKAANENKMSNPKLRTYVEGKEFTWATGKDYLLPEFDDYILVKESAEQIKEDASGGAPY